MNFDSRTRPSGQRLQSALSLVARKARTGVRCTLWRLHQEFRVRRNRLSLLNEEWQLGSGLCNPEFRLWGWYGRIGNNVQQLIVAIAHAEKFNGRTGIGAELLQNGPLHDIVSQFDVNFANSDLQQRAVKVYCTTFFHYTEYTFSKNDLRRMAYRKGHSPRRDCLIG
ncbi:MAG: hypothetical protein QUV07_10485 [Cyanobium sp. CZS 25K]|nr:hypothetical protein [Cyanobium sp. CZS25K]